MTGDQQFRFGGDRKQGPRQIPRLIAAYEQLEEALETLDLEENPGVAEAVIDAVRATDRAYRLSLSQR